MKLIFFIRAFLNYILDGFGFTDLRDFKISTFSYMYSVKIWILTMPFSTFIVLFTDKIEKIFGISFSFLIAYVFLVFFEWLTGIMASAKRQEKHSSRKLGRMLFKIAVYSVPLYVFNTFSKEIQFPTISDFQLNPFRWLYWTVIIVIIWQLFVSVLENLEQLNVKYAKIMLKIINKKFYKTFEIKEENEK